MKKLLLPTIISFLVAGFASSASANLIVNGSFENPALSKKSWHVYTSIDGWNADYGRIEVQNNAAGSPYDGAQFVELDSNYNSVMSQTLSTNSGQTYLLEFAYSPRPNVNYSSNIIDVFWNGTSLTSNTGISADGGKTTIWSLLNFTVTGTGSDKLTFKALGISDSLGGYIDAVSLESVPVPEPATMLLMGVGMFGIAGALRRRKN
ncbi:MAG: PEP-CTERM sorting domain-containing protein [Desulfobulbus sp.]